MSSEYYNFFPRVVLHRFFSFLFIYGGLGVGVLGLWSWIGFWGGGEEFS